MAMNAFKWNRLAHDLGSTVSGTILSAAHAAGKTPVEIARIASTKPDFYSARYTYWDAVTTPYDAPGVVVGARL